MLCTDAAKNDGVTFPMMSSSSSSSATIRIAEKSIVYCGCRRRDSSKQMWMLAFQFIIRRFQWLVFFCARLRSHQHFFPMHSLAVCGEASCCTENCAHIRHKNKYCSRRKRIIMIIYDEISQKQFLFIQSTNERNVMNGPLSRSACRSCPKFHNIHAFSL